MMLVLSLLFVTLFAQKANQPPTVRLSVSPAQIYVGTLVTFDGSSTTDPDSPLGRQRWTYNFGDGTSRTGRGVVLAVQHTYASAGTFTMTLVVQDSRGAVGTATAFVNVLAQPPPPPTDTTPPSAPSNVVATATSSTSIQVSWSASIDNVGVTGYRVERCIGISCASFTTLTTTTSLLIVDNNLTATSSYSYRVLATDAATNLSAYSNIASATTPSGVDTTPPTAPAGLTATASTPTQVGVSWTAATDDVGVTGYRLERCLGAGCTTFLEISTQSGLTYSDSNLTAATIYRYRVRAVDAAGNFGPYSLIASVTTPAAPDTTPPTTPTNLNASVMAQTSFTITWSASTDASGIANYEVWMTNVLVQTVTGTTANFTALTCETLYTVAVNAVDTVGNKSVKASLTIQTAMCDTTGPPQNPTKATFTPSPDHNTVVDGQNVVTSYVLDVIPASGSMAVASKDIGKLIPDASNMITYSELPTILATVPNGDYVAKVAAIGPGGSTLSTISNVFSVLNSSPPPPTGQPYGGVAQSLPGTLQLENFDEGGPGVAFSDTSSGNIGGVYRTTDVDLTPVSDAPGGYAVGWTAETEWTQYTVNVQTTGTYTLGFRVASGGSAGTFHLNVNGVNVTGSMQVPDTGSWQTYTTIFKTGVTLQAGLQTWRLVMDTRNSTTGEIGDFNWISVQ